jgi:2-amino-4-hydroxy-6-hydroxymethyldihydropteridine diphosphokinase
MIFLGLGSNLGDKKGNLEQALDLLAQEKVRIVRTSSFYETQPWGNLAQDPFLNMVAEVSFEGNPLDLLDIILGIEQKMGRVRMEKWGPRIIDIDILEFNRITLQTPNLTIPHPYYPERDFVMIPLRELEPDWIPTKTI